MLLFDKPKITCYVTGFILPSVMSDPRLAQVDHSMGQKVQKGKYVHDTMYYFAYM